MLAFLSILNPLLYNHNTINVKMFFALEYVFKITNNDIIKKYAIYKFNKYKAVNVKDYNL